MPPLAFNEPEYAEPVLPEGRVAVVTFKGCAATAIKRAAVLLCAGLPESATVTVKRATPLAAGVPEITPVLAFSPRPDGKLPALIDHLYGVVPPLACKAAVYAEPLVPEVKSGVAIVKGVIAAAATDIARLTVDFCTGELESKAVIPTA